MTLLPNGEPTPKLTVRVAQRGDIEALVRLRSLLLDDGMGIYASRSPEESMLWRRHYREWLEDKLERDSEVYVAVAINELDEPAGCAIGIIDQRAPCPGAYNGLCGWIQTVVVDPIWRKQGIGIAVVEFIHDWFRSNGITKWVLQTTPHAEMLYQRLGYRDTGERTLYRIEEGTA